MKCELADRDGLLKHLRILKSIQVDGVKVDCWWGIAECHSPQEYNWNGYRQLFQIVRDLNLKIQVSVFMSLCLLVVALLYQHLTFFLSFLLGSDVLS